MRAPPSIDSISVFSTFQLFAFQLIPIYPFWLRELIYCLRYFLNRKTQFHVHNRSTLNYVNSNTLYRVPQFLQSIFWFSNLSDCWYYCHAVWLASGIGSPGLSAVSSGTYHSNSSSLYFGYSYSCASDHRSTKILCGCSRGFSLSPDGRTSLSGTLH